MYQIPYFALAGLLVTFGVPVALMAACGLAQLRLAHTHKPGAFPQPLYTGLALGVAQYLRSTQSGWGVLAAQVLVYWGQGAFAGSAAGWAAVYAARYQKRKGLKFP